jgi:hypothetical protein
MARGGGPGASRSRTAARGGRPGPGPATRVRGSTSPRRAARAWSWTRRTASGCSPTRRRPRGGAAAPVDLVEHRGVPLGEGGQGLVDLVAGGRRRRPRRRRAACRHLAGRLQAHQRGRGQAPLRGPEALERAPLQDPVAGRPEVPAEVGEEGQPAGGLEVAGRVEQAPHRRRLELVGQGRPAAGPHLGERAGPWAATPRPAAFSASVSGRAGVLPAAAALAPGAARLTCEGARRSGHGSFLPGGVGPGIRAGPLRLPLALRGLGRPGGRGGRQHAGSRRRRSPRALARQGRSSGVGGRAAPLGRAIAAGRQPAGAGQLGSGSSPGLAGQAQRRRRRRPGWPRRPRSAGPGRSRRGARQGRRMERADPPGEPRGGGRPGGGSGAPSRTAGRPRPGPGVRWASRPPQRCHPGRPGRNRRDARSAPRSRPRAGLAPVGGPGSPAAARTTSRRAARRRPRR